MPSPPFAILAAISVVLGLTLVPALCFLTVKEWPLRACIAALVGLIGLWCWAALVVPLAWLGPSMALAWGLLVLALVDVAELRLPDMITLPLLAGGMLAAMGMAGGAPFSHGLGAMLGYGAFTGLAWSYRRVRGRDGLGQGDAKLLAAAGAWLGWQALPSVVLIASLLALVVFAPQCVLARQRPSSAEAEPLPFGPPLCAGTWLVWLYGGWGY